MTQLALTRRVKYWAMRLQLGNWKIKATFVPQAAFRKSHGPDADYFADCECVMLAQKATIRVCDPSEWPADTFDIDATIVHELLHVRLDPSEKMGRYDTWFEAGLDAIAAALVKSRRGAP